MGLQKRWTFIWRMVLIGTFSMGGGLACRRQTPPPEDPLRQRVIGSWVAGRTDGNRAFAILDLKPDGTFEYEFHIGAKPPMKLSGEWTIEDDGIVGLVRIAENSLYKAGDSFPFGTSILVDDNTMKLRKQTGIDEYHRSSNASKNQ